MFQMFLIWIAATLISAYLRPKPKVDSPQPSALGDIQAPTAEYGRVVPVFYGRVHAKGANCVWYGDLRTEAITETVDGGWFSEDQTMTKGYRYYLGMQLVFCHGMSPRDLERGSGLVELRFDGKRPTATTNPTYPQYFNGALLRGANSGGATYTAEYFNENDYNTRYARVHVNEPNIFGGDDQGEGGFAGDVDFYFGQGGQLPNDYLAGVWGESEVPAFRGYCYAVLRQCYLGNSRYIKNVSAIIQRYPWLFSAVQGYDIDGDANPIAIIADLLTNTSYGLGRPLAQLDLASFEYAAAQCNAERLGMSVIYDNKAEAQDLIYDVLRHVDGVLYRDPTSGQYKIKLARDDYDERDLLELNPDNIVELSMTRSAWADTKNVVKIRYTDREQDYKTAVVEHKNQANIDIRGTKDEDTYDFLGISNAETANKVAARVLKSVSTPLARFSLKANREAFKLHPGAVFKLVWPALGISGMVCRITNIAYGQLTEPQIRIDAVEDIFGAVETQVHVPGGSSWVNPAHEQLQANPAEQLVEAPFHLAGGELRKVMTMATRAGSLALGYSVRMSEGGQLVETQRVPAFTPSGVLTSAYARTTDAIDTAGFTVQLGAGAAAVLKSISESERLAGKNLLLVDGELMTWQTITANGDGTHTLGGVVRGVLDTVAEAHTQGARVWFISSGLGLVRQAALEADGRVEAKLLPYNQTDTLPAADAAVLAVDTHSRAFKPYAPGRLRLNGQAWPTTLTGGSLTVAWEHRPKAALLSMQRIIGQDDQGYGLESGTMYTVEVWADGTLVETATGLTANSYTYTPATMTPGQVFVVKVWASNAAGSSRVQESTPFTLTA